MTELSEKIAERVLEMINAQPRTPRRVELALEIQRLLDEYAAKDCEPEYPRYIVKTRVLPVGDYVGLPPLAIIGVADDDNVFVAGWNIDLRGERMTPRSVMLNVLDYINDLIEETPDDKLKL